MSSLNFAKTFFGSLYRSKILRVLLILSVLLLSSFYLTYRYWAMPWLNRAISENYFQQTGHKLQHDQLVVNLRLCQLNLANLKDSSNLWQADSLDIDIDCKNSFHRRGFIANSITVKNLVANPLQQENGSWNFEEMLNHMAAANAPKNAKANTEQQAPVFVVKKLTISNAKINSNALALNNLPLAITPLNVTLTNLDFSRKSRAEIALKATINQTATLSLSGKMDLKTLDGELDSQLQAMPFKWLSAVLKPYVALEILQGVIDDSSHIVVAQGLPQTISSSGKLTHLKVRPTTMEQDAVKWKSLEWQSAEVDMNKKTIHVPQLLLDQLDGELIITKDRTTNIQAMIIKPVPEAPSEKLSPANQPAPANQPWKFVVDKLAVNNAALGFFDESLKPSFSVIIQQFTGDIVDIANDPAHIAVINLQGNVDGYAPVRLNGKANFFIEQPELGILFSFEKMDMGAFSPYSAEYAGWRIKKGLLSVELNYHYDHGLIVGKNHLVIDHLEFGEKVRSPHMVDLPLRLGLSLLTDENGIAVLDADISGDPKNPQFNVRETIWRALRNTLKKVAAAPFRLLANLLKTKEDLGRIEFKPGDSQLSEHAIVKLKLLQEAMQKRPKMRLTIHGVYDEHADLEALKREQVNSALQKLGVAKDAVANRNADWAKAVSALYKTQMPTGALASPEEQYDALALQQTVLPERLSTLAHERAQAVKQYFVLQLGVASETMLLDSDNNCDETNVCVASAVIFTLED